MKTKEDFNIRMLQEIGLEIDKTGHVVDQDTGTKLQFKGKHLKVGPCNREEIPFDPFTNSNIMSSLFGYFVSNKMEEEGRYVSTYYSTTKERNERGTIELKEGEEVVASAKYYSDSLKYGDLILKLNGNGGEDLSALDEEFMQSTKSDR